uniref:Integrase catalytic domain-containing protein n=1 Tax=Astatotilapia calliptera TaxID=8154 RepID=A0A3P8QS69_ASTCA
MENDSVVMFKQPVPLELTSSGHYCVDIRDENTTESCNENEVLMVTAEMSTKEKQKVLVKLHKQFGHASAERLLRLIQSSGNTDKQCAVILQEIVRDCDICQKYCKTKPRPAVGLPLASEYNETVAMDLHELEPNVWYLHIIDHFTRFSAGSIVKTKKAAEIVNSFIHTWISIHGAPRRLYTDNGGEFNNTDIRDMAENFNIEVKTTAGYSPWSNGLLERHNMTLTEILLKSKDASNTCHLTSLLLLKVSIYEQFGAVGSKMSSLQQLCSLLPFNPWHWFSLGQMCLQLLDRNRTTESSSSESCKSTDEQEDREGHQEETAELSEDRVWLKACTCFIRTRLLLRILRQQQSSFVLQRSERVLQMTEEALQRLNPKQETLQALTEVMSEDLIPEKMREDYQDGESLTSVSLHSFRQRWWNKILLTGVLETDGQQHETQYPHAAVLTVYKGEHRQEGSEEPAEDVSDKQHSECGRH